MEKHGCDITRLTTHGFILMSTLAQKSRLILKTHLATLQNALNASLPALFNDTFPVSCKLEKLLEVIPIAAKTPSINGRTVL